MCASKRVNVRMRWREACSHTDKGYHSKNMSICWLISFYVPPPECNCDCMCAWAVTWRVLCARQKASSKAWHSHHRTWHAGLASPSLLTWMLSRFFAVRRGDGGGVLLKPESSLCVWGICLFTPKRPVVLALPQLSHRAFRGEYCKGSSAALMAPRFIFLETYESIFGRSPCL